MGKVTYCPNRRGQPRVPIEVCEFHIKEKDLVCRKRDSLKKLRCPVAREILEKKAEVV